MLVWARLRRRKVKQISYLLHFHGCAGVGELFLDGLGLFLVHTLFDRLGRTIHQIFGLFETQVGDFANGLDDVDLVGARAGEDHVELGFLLNRRRCRPAATGGSNRNSRSRRRNSQLLFEHLDELRRLEQRQPLNLFRYCVDVRHCLVHSPYSENLFSLTPWSTTTARLRPTPPKAVTRRCAEARIKNKTFASSSSRDGIEASS